MAPRCNVTSEEHHRLCPVHALRYLGRLDVSVPFEELERRSWVNEGAHAAGRHPAFSQGIHMASR